MSGYWGPTHDILRNQQHGYDRSKISIDNLVSRIFVFFARLCFDENPSVLPAIMCVPLLFCKPVSHEIGCAVEAV